MLHTCSSFYLTPITNALQLRLHATCGASPPLPERLSNDSLPSLPVEEPEPGLPDGQSFLRKILYHPSPIPQRGATEWRLLSSQGPSAHLNISLPIWAQSPRRRLNLIIRCHWDPTWRRPGRRSGSLTQRTRDSSGTLVRRRGAGSRAARVRAYAPGVRGPAALLREGLRALHVASICCPSAQSLAPAASRTEGTKGQTNPALTTGICAVLACQGGLSLLNRVSYGHNRNSLSIIVYQGLGLE